MAAFVYRSSHFFMPKFITFVYSIMALKKVFGLLFWVMMVTNTTSWAQAPSNDSLKVETSPKQNSVVKKDTTTTKKHSPKLATILSAVVPGSGQIYNKKYWKAPVVYAALGAAIYGVSFYTKEFNKFSTAYQERLATGTNTDAFYAQFQTPTLQNYRDSYRYNRDMCYIALGGAYILQVVDAAVDAHFFDFKITEDLSLNITPIITPLPQQASTGLLFNLKF